MDIGNRLQWQDGEVPELCGRYAGGYSTLCRSAIQGCEGARDPERFEKYCSKDCLKCDYISGGQNEQTN